MSDTVEHHIDSRFQDRSVFREEVPESILLNGRVFYSCGQTGCVGLFPSRQDRDAHFREWHVNDDERRDESDFYDPRKNRDQPTFPPRRRDQPQRRPR